MSTDRPLVILAGPIHPDGVANLEREARDRPDQSLELLVAGDEVGPAVDLDQRPPPGRHLEPDQTLGGDPARLLGGRGQALLAQPVDRRFEVTRRFRERGLAIHHARAGLVTQLLDERRGYYSHGLSFPCRVPKPWAPSDRRARPDPGQLSEAAS